VEPEGGATWERLLAAARLGVFGGTFDPVHRGHLHVARAATRAFALDGVLFVPAARSPHKRGSAEAAPADRLAMLELALADEPTFAAAPLELERGAPSFTIDTVLELERRRSGSGGELFLLLGSDNLEGLCTWREVEDLLARTTPIVVARAGSSALPSEGLHGLSPAAAERLRVGFVDAPTVDVSATELRAALARGEGEAELSPPVWEYIRERGIYART